MNPSFLPAHHPPKAVIRDVLRGGLQVVFGGGLVVQQRPTAGLAVGLLAQAVGEGVVPGEKDRCELGGLRSQQPRCGTGVSWEGFAPNNPGEGQV